MFDISFSGTSVILVAAPELLGDLDQNGIVDFGDDVLLQNLPGTNNPLPNDGGLGVPIGVPHYELSKANFGGPGLNLVPEPSGMGLIAAGALIGRQRLRKVPGVSLKCGENRPFAVKNTHL